MKTVFNFRIDLFRNKFSIYGFSNIAAFLCVLMAGLLIPKVIQYKVGHYALIIMLATVAYFGFLIEVVLKKESSDDIILVRTCFDKVDICMYERYMNYYKYIIYQFIYLWLSFPVNKEGITDYIHMVFAFEILTTMAILIHSKCSEVMFNTIRQIIVIGLAIVLMLVARNKITIPQISFGQKIIFWEMIFAFVCVVGAVKILGKGTERKNSKLLDKCCKIKFVANNKDYLFFLKKSKFIDPILIMVVLCSISVGLREEVHDIFLTYMAIFCYWFYYVYIELLKYESKNYVFIYSFKELKSMKKEKMLNTTKIVTCMLFLAVIPLSILCSFCNVVISFAISLTMFIVNSLIMKFRYERRKGYEKVITDVEQIKYIVMFAIEMIVIGFI